MIYVFVGTYIKYILIRHSLIPSFIEKLEEVRGRFNYFVPLCQGTHFSMNKGVMVYIEKN